MTITPSQPAITATGLRKSFGDKLVLDGIDLDVPQGTVFALLGPNGAGKTTTVHILSTLIGADGAKCESPAMTWPATRTRSGPRSASPASSRRWTTCSPARRTCS
jgi:ABC-type branched-subunit amino acid transport system ATPase component